MDLRFQKRLLDLSIRMFVKGEGMPSPITFAPQKTAILPAFSETAHPFERATPEQVGLSEAHIEGYLSALEANREVNLHSLVVLRDGKLILSGSARPYSTIRPQLTYSMSKTVVAMAIGLLISEGKLSLDRRAYSLFPPSRLPALLSSRVKAITVEHLLTMQTGIFFNEGGSVTEEDWIRSFFDSAVKFEPGTAFAYNSMNSYILSAIVREVSGQPLGEFLEERLWKPLGITSHFWEKCPMGIEKGGWGLYLRPYDMAKLGQLMLDGGSFGGHRVLPESWVREMLRAHAEVPTEAGNYNYGYQMWVNRDGGSALFNGMFGQNIWLCHDTRTVVAMTSGNCEVFQKSPALRITEEFFGGEAKCEPAKAKKAKTSVSSEERVIFERRAWVSHGHRADERPRCPIARLLSLLLGRRRQKQESFPEELRAHLGKYVFDRNNVGLLPMLVRLFQNNHSPGITSLTLEERDGRPFVTITEGASDYRFEMGFGGHVESVLNYNGELYSVAVAAEFVTNEDGERLMKIEFAFPEIPSTRRAKLYFYGDELQMRLSERPGRDIIPELLDSACVTMPKSVPIANFAKSKLEIDFISTKITDAFDRRIRARRRTD